MTLELSSIIFLLCQNYGLRQKIDRRRSAASTLRPQQSPQQEQRLPNYMFKESNRSQERNRQNKDNYTKKDDNVVIHNQISVVPE